MSQPPILIVDENDKPIGSATMAEAEAKSMIRRIARIMLFNSARQVLLQKRSATVTVYPDRWDNSVAGHVDAGEETLQAAKREMFEEIGLEGIKLEFIGSYYYEDRQSVNIVRKFNHVYQGKTEEMPTNLAEDEVSRVEWFDLGGLKRQLAADPDRFTDGVQEVIRRYY